MSSHRIRTTNEPPKPETFVRRLPENWLRTDVILAVVVAFVSVLSLQALRLTDIYTGSGLDLVLTQVFSLVISFLLVLYRRFPITIAAIYTLLIVALAFISLSLNISSESYSLLFVGFMTIYSVGAWVSNRRVAFWVRLFFVLAQWSGSIAITVIVGFDEAVDPKGAMPDLSTGDMAYVLGTTLVISLGYYASAWYFGGRAWNRARERWKLETAHDQLAQANAKIADAAVQAERLHIARELHDVIAHHVTVMGVHASAARRLVEAQRDPTAVVDQLEHIEASSAQAVHELQTMVYTLRDQDGSTEPLPDLSQLPELVRQADSTTQTVTCEVVGEPIEVSAAVELTLYRVAQEALSNARKHAGDDVEVQVKLDYTDQDITLSVTDNGKAYDPVLNGTGTGIQGMKERVHAVDGTLEYGPRAPYGWKVIVRVPCARSMERVS
ncbi:sensor histidine kinase [Enteractinococcus coprophilus]|uniref:histidine kinase n=1 Tax=Enteractinococcus coprophilus TaxID=1027633 RepID=A0A543AG18_9MICC|nr:sensor histidine kinase [Enteractinococcus coprophilus]TQL71518.1 signal transduction histidine kinase [Enteractinococcus coprophilus]